MRLVRYALAFLLLAVCAFAEEADAAAPEDIEIPEDVEIPEAEALSDTFSNEEREELTKSQETHEFKAETSRLMDIIINSLYANREIFLRELISNAADALDKVRFQSLTDPSVLKDTEEFDIRIQADQASKTISITDTGVGMTRQDLINNLGTVAKSGTSEFLDAAATGDGLSLIGQFGVGFYSVYLVADKVTVISKNVNDEQYIWESTAQNTFSVTKDPRGNTLGRGTQIILHLKDDAESFLVTKSLTDIVTRYSQFINFPILMHTITENEKEVPVEKEEKEESEEKSEDDEDVVEVSEEDEEEPEMETIVEEVESWERVNDAQPLWTRNPAEITEEEYAAFYSSFTKDTGGYAEKIHFVAEGEISFKALLFVPKELDSKVYENYYSKNTNIKLYVRRVLISDEFDDFLPRYMNFVKGVVDSDDLPLNVSRETLAQSRVLKVMAKKLARKVIEMLKKMAERSQPDDDEETEAQNDGDEEGEDGEEAEEKESEEDDDYTRFWKNYGKSIKMGIMEEEKDKTKLSGLMRFISSKSNGKLISFEQYVDNMADDQKSIFYMTGETPEKMMAHPIMEGFAKRDLEVLLLHEAVDEYSIIHVHDIDGIMPTNIAKQGSDAAHWKTSKAFAADQEESKPFGEWAKEVLGDRVKKVEHSAMLEDSPAAITCPQFGGTPNQERVAGAQSLSDTKVHVTEKNFAFNWRHPIIKKIAAMALENKEDPRAINMVTMLFESAQIYSGFIFHDAADFSARVNKLVASSLGVDPDAVAEPEEEEEEVEEEVEEDEAEEEAAAEDEEVEEAEK